MSLLTEIEMISRKVIIDLAKESLAKKTTTTSKSLQEKLKEKIDRPTLDVEKPKAEVSKLKERAEEIKKIKAREALESRRKALRERVESIYGPGSAQQADTKIDPELLEKERLINNIKMVLQATPLGKEVSIRDIAKKVKHDNLDEVEQVVTALVERKEVRGFYDIWEGRYYVGDVSTRFIEQTLNCLALTPTEIDYIKISRGGEVEILLKNNDDTNASAIHNDTLVVKKPSKVGGESSHDA